MVSDENIIKNGQKAFLNPIRAFSFGKLMFLFFFRGTTKQLITFVEQLTRKINKKGRYLKLVTKLAELA